MFNFKREENENQEFIFPDNLSRIALLSFYIILIALGFLFYKFVILTEIERVKLLDFAVRYQIMGTWINLILGFFFIPSIIMMVFGIKIICEKRYPSLGARVAVKTRIIRGKKAVRLGIGYLVFGSTAVFLLSLSIITTGIIRKSFVENPFKWVSKSSWEKAGLQRPKF
ncbi:MAG: hypothetical protein LBH98_02245 [Chitinispirillales bacterium]|jgi:hypothetical protein|nr:hypothetical protein [Chitinispirillales bacterium]